jgi:hypothetical protein
VVEPPLGPDVTDGVRGRTCCESDTDNERAGGATDAVLLAGFGCPAGPERIELAGGVLAGALYASRVERGVRTGGDGRESD